MTDHVDPELEGPSAARRLFRWVCCCGCVQHCVSALQQWRRDAARERRKRSIHVIRPDDGDSSAEEQSLLGRTPSLTSSGYSSPSSRDLKSNLYSQIALRRTAGPGRPPRSSSGGAPVVFWPGVPTPVLPLSARESHGIQPQLYRPPDDPHHAPYHVGRIRFSMAYQAVPGTLLVRVLEARDLAPPPHGAHVGRAQSNPYVRVCLTPGPRRCRQTAVRRRTQNPHFDQTFAFEVAFRELERLRLRMLVKDFDRFSRQRTVGELVMPLSHEAHLTSGEVIWRPLLPCPEDDDCGDVLLTLGYLPRAGRLNIDLVRCRHLPAVDMDGRTDPCVRVSLVLDGRHVKTKRTACLKMTTEPVFNERLSFRVSSTQLADVSLVVTVWDGRAAVAAATERPEPLGRIVFGKHATGAEEVAHWCHLTQARRTPGSQWHGLKTRAYCDKISSVAQSVP